VPAAQSLLLAISNSCSVDRWVVFSLHSVRCSLSFFQYSYSSTLVRRLP
jgi:hypothetical protein